MLLFCFTFLLGLSLKETECMTKVMKVCIGNTPRFAAQQVLKAPEKCASTETLYKNKKTATLCLDVDRR